MAFEFERVMVKIFKMILPVIGMLPPLMAHAQDDGFATKHYGRPRTLVAIQGGRHLNMVCIGTGKPTVIFLSGLGGGTFDWRKVQPAIGKVARACAYDRAGYGFSASGPAPVDLDNTILDLHALLHSKTISTPVVLVGHSLGGLYATVYARRYRADLAGMVLVDPAFAGQQRAIALAIGPQAAGRMAASDGRTLTMLDRCVALAKSGRLSTPAEAKSDCLDNPPDPDGEVHRERDREEKTYGFERAIRSEFRSANITDADHRTIDDRQSAVGSRDLRDLPLGVLTRGNGSDLPGLSAQENAKADAAWREGHDRLAALSTAGSNTIVPRSGHFIQLDQPDAVIAAIRQLLDRLR